MIPADTPPHTLVTPEPPLPSGGTVGVAAEYLGPGSTADTFAGRPAGSTEAPSEYLRREWRLGGYAAYPQISPPAKMSPASRERLEREANTALLERIIQLNPQEPGFPMLVKLRGGRDPFAAEATDATLRALPMPGSDPAHPTHLHRDSDGKVHFTQDGWAILWTCQPRFTKWAILRQGYVADVGKTYALTSLQTAIRT